MFNKVVKKIFYHSLNFDYIPIENISSRAFDLEKYSDGVIDIYLNNCSLTESSIENNVFSDPKRRLNIDLSKKNFFLLVRRTP